LSGEEGQREEYSFGRHGYRLLTTLPFV
jgi:hypothetical protein